MKTTYLINQMQPDGSIQLTAVPAAEWFAVVKENRQLPPEQRRYFILDYIVDKDEFDCMVIEAPFDVYRTWNKEHLATRRRRKAGERFQHLSLDAPGVNQNDSRPLLDLIASEYEVEAEACDLILLDELRSALSAWKPWANDLLDAYLNGQKRTCTNILAKKYSVSPQAIRKYKRQFEAFIKKFLEVFRFNP